MKPTEFGLGVQSRHDERSAGIVSVVPVADLTLCHGIDVSFGQCLQEVILPVLDGQIDYLGNVSEGGWMPVLPSNSGDAPAAVM